MRWLNCVTCKIPFLELGTEIKCADCLFIEKALDYDAKFREAVRKLYHWQNSYSDCFSDQVFNLLKKADNNNRVRLRLAFPFEHHTLEAWEAAGNYGNDLFDKWLKGDT